MCQVFGVSRSGYYNWVQHEPSDRKQSDERLKLEIKVAHIRTRETYGTRRLQTELAENGIIVGRDRLARLRKELRLRCKQKRKFRATTNSNHNLPVAPNLLNQTFAPTAPNQVWVADLTYVATQEGWLYLAGIKDVYTCEIVGYAMGERMTKELTGKALFMALRSQRPPAGLIHHSDRGSQYCAYDYRVIQEQFGLKTSMSRKGNCYDNAPMESFWGTLKNESLSHYRFNNRDEAISVIREYIEIFYNRQRRHSRLGNISPAAFREKYHQMAVLKKRTNGSVRYCQYTSNNAKLFRAGQMKVLKPYVDSGKIKVVGDQWVDGWLPENALKIMENALTANNNKIDAVVASNDATAGGAIQALSAQGLSGKVAISGQDADLAGIKRMR